MRSLAAFLAILGGLVLVIVILTTVTSVAGRALLWVGLGPIRGDFELVELAPASPSFLPAMGSDHRQHASVEILTMHMGDSANRLIDLIADLLMLAIAVLLTWKHWDGTLDKFAYGETTFIIQYPIWRAYASGLVGAFGFVLISFWCDPQCPCAVDRSQPDAWRDGTLTNIDIALLSFPVLLLLIFLRIPIGLAMLITGIGGSYFINGSFLMIFAQLKNLTWGTFSSYSLSIIPLFLLMGQFATLGGMSQALFKAAETWMGHKKGGVAMAAVAMGRLRRHLRFLAGDGGDDVARSPCPSSRRYG